MEVKLCALSDFVKTLDFEEKEEEADVDKTPDEVVL